MTTNAQLSHRDRVARWNTTATAYPRDATTHQLFEEQVHRAPDAPAVDDGDRALTYRQLDRRANALARRLVDAGVAPGDRVGVLLRSSAEAVVAILGVLKAGAAYVPLDPDSPDARAAALCRRVGIRVVVARPWARPPSDALRRVPAEVDGTGMATPPPVAERTADDLAYLIFTSGSSGEPKAVAVPHRGPVRLIRNTNYVDVGPADTVLSTTNLTFDISCGEIWSALLTGARLVVVSTETLLSPAALAECIETERATVMWLSTGVFHEVAAARPGMFTGLRYLLVGGDALNPGIVRGVLRQGPPQHFVNGYGPTENAVLSTAHEIDQLDEDAETVPIGRPIANSTAYVLREDLALADVGEVGGTLRGR